MNQYRLDSAALLPLGFTEEPIRISDGKSSDEDNTYIKCVSLTTNKQAKNE